jgi:hypothetical protein
MANASRSWFDNDRNWVVWRDRAALSSSRAALREGSRDLEMLLRRSVGVFLTMRVLRVDADGVSSRLDTEQRARGPREGTPASTLTEMDLLRVTCFATSSLSLLIEMGASSSPLSSPSLSLSLSFSIALTISLSSNSQVPAFSLMSQSIWWARSTCGGHSALPVGLETLTSCKEI